jgi:hypothetical protein
MMVQGAAAYYQQFIAISFWRPISAKYNGIYPMAKIDPSSLHHRMSVDEGWVLDVLLVVILTTLPDIAHR